jgi:hypothetical protein
MRRKNYSISTSSAEIKYGARLTVKEKRFGWHVPKNHDKLAAIQCEKQNTVEKFNENSHLPLGSQAQSYTGLSTPASIEAVPEVFIKKMSLPP